jgi:hypothetical protein
MTAVLGSSLKRGALVALTIALAATFSTSPTRAKTVADRSQTKFGIYYLGWQCIASAEQVGQPYNITRAVAGQQAWGPISVMHWWDEPAAGYYCVSSNGTVPGSSETVLAYHARLLRDAGIDFIFYDSTNNPYDDTASGPWITQPLEKLLQVWSQIPGAPRVVPWAPATQSSTMIDRMNYLVGHYGMQFTFTTDNKPLLFVVDRVASLLPDEARLITLRNSYTVRKMWSFYPDNDIDPDHWSFMAPCGWAFKPSSGLTACGQRVTPRDGGVEAVSITTAYQAGDSTLMSDPIRAVPKFGGRTFWQQLHRAYDLAPNIVTITGWNEWIAQRGCWVPGTDPAIWAGFGCTDGDAASVYNGRKPFADQYDREYNRDIEPAAYTGGSKAYELLKACVLAYKQSQLCGMPAEPAVDVLQPGESLYAGQSKTSSDGRFTLVYQTDGNLVLYQSGVGWIWANWTYGIPPGQTVMQTAGNLVTYSASGQAVWWTAQSGIPGSRLVVQRDGNTVIYSPDGTPVWSTGTCCR